MSVRARLFLLLLALSVLPVLVQRLTGQMAMENLSKDLVQRSRHMLIAKAKDHMRLMVEDHAEMWRREGLLLEQTLRLQAAHVASALARPQTGVGNRESLTQAYAASAAGLEDRHWGQLTVFEDGQVSTSSDEFRLPHRFDARQTPWYRLAVGADGPVWTAPVIDPTTRRIGLTLSAPIRDASNRVVGVTALMAPLDIGGVSREHTLGISPQLRTYLVDFNSKDAPAKGLRIIGQASGAIGDAPGGSQDGAHGMGRGRGMLGVAEPGWLSPDDPIDLSLILSDLKHGLSEVRQGEMDGRDWLWGYAPTRVEGVALVLVAPKKDVIIDATQSGEYIEERISRQLHLTLALLACVLLLVAGSAWLVSRSVTRPLSDLARMADKLGEGDFSVRVTPSGGREFMELGRVFNEMVPELEESTRLKQAMALAREVHQRLLPGEMPALAGLDLAAVSIPCQETGGDSFDVIPAAHDNPDRTALLVGDVTGHGLDAALLMATARAYLRMRVRQPGTPAQVVTDVNRFLSLDTGDTGRFMTLFYLEANPRSNVMRWVRAGHDPAILYRAAADDFQELGGPGIPLGVLDDRTFQEYSQPMPDSGDVLLIGSDGLWEARGPDGSMFGKERVRAVLSEHASSPAQGILDTLLGAWNDFRGDVPAEDDVTLMVVKTVNTGEA